MTGEQWVTVLMAAIAAISSGFAAWLSARNGRAIRTDGGKTIGQHVEDLGTRLDALTPPPCPPDAVPYPEHPWAATEPTDPSTGRK